MTGQVLAAISKSVWFSRLERKLAIIVLIMGLITTLVSALFVKSGIDRIAHDDFNVRCREIARAITQRLDDHARILLSGAAFFQASDEITREKWRVFTRRLKIENQLPGIQGIGYSILIPPDELYPHIQSVRAEGFPEYTIKPAGLREVYSSIIFLEPFTGRNLRAFGYDMLSEPVRRIAMERARDTDSAALSGRVILVQETEKNVQPGSLMYVPVYRKGMPIDTIEHRRAAVCGWVYSPYRMNDMIDGILGGRYLEKDTWPRLEIFDGAQALRENLLYGEYSRQDETSPARILFARQLPVDFNGHCWTLRFTKTGTKIFAAEYSRVWLVTVGGMVISLLMGVLVRILLTTRTTALQLASELTADLRKSEASRQSILSSTADGILAVDENWRVLEANMRFSDLWHVPRTLIDAGDDKAVLSYVKDQLVDPETFVREVRRLFASTEDSNDTLELKGGRFFERRSSPLIVLGKLRGRVWSFSDITERKRSEKASQTAARYARSLLEASLDPLMTISVEGNITDANTAAEQVIGVDRNILMGSSFEAYFTDPNRARQGYQQAFFKGFVADYPLSIRHVSGKITDVLCNSSVFRDVDGNVEGVFVAARDITERMRIEAELLKMQKLESVGTLAGGIAHDFNNILMGLFGYISLAKDKLPKDHPGYALLEESEKCRKRAVGLTKQLLTFAKGGVPILEDVRIERIVEEVIRFDLSGSDVLLVLNQAADLWVAKADKGQIQSVISNLAINAREAMPNGGHLYVTLKNAEVQEGDVTGLHSGKYIKVTIRDEGVGISADNINRIFDPYYSTKKVGSGLGLTTVYSIIGKHGGHIGVVSEPEKGSTFTFYLPIAECPHSADPKPVEESSVLLKHSLKILVMDDEIQILTIVTKMLEQGGNSVVSVTGGKEAVAAYQQAMESGNPFDCVILDLTIPGGIGGKETIINLLAIDPHVRAIVSSGYADDPVMANYAEYGFKGVAEKPYSKRRLLEVLSQVLE